MDDDPRDAPDHDEEIDALFRKMAEERGNEVNLLLRVRRPTDGNDLSGGLQGMNMDDAGGQAEPRLRAVDTLHLYEAVTLGRWDKVPSHIRPMCVDNESVLVMDTLVDGLMAAPLQSRPVWTPHMVLCMHEQEGAFRDLLTLEVFCTVATRDRYLMCTTLSRRLNVDSILTASYVFLLIDAAAWTQANVDTRAAPEQGIVKLGVQGFQVLKEKARLANFFYEYLPWKVSTALPSMKYK